MVHRIMVSLIILACACSAASTIATAEQTAQLQVTSPAFDNGKSIPKIHTCDGKDVSPPLRISGVPKGTKSIVLIADDPDAPGGTWVHWVLFNLPADLTDLPEGIPPDPKLSNGGIHGRNSWEKQGYGGPCPPSGTHRYYFKFYALDTKLNLKSYATEKQVVDAMKGHILAEGSLMGRYKRQR